MNCDHIMNQPCTVQERTVTYNGNSGQQVQTWTNVGITLTASPIGTGTGALLIFTTGRKAVSAVTAVYVNGVLKATPADYSVSNLNDVALPATITFVIGSVPALDAVITCTYTHKDSDCDICRLDMATGGEKRLPKKIYERVTHLMFMKYRTDLDYKEKRIKIGTTVYDILLVTPAGGIKSHVELAVELVD